MWPTSLSEIDTTLFYLLLFGASFIISFIINKLIIEFPASMEYEWQQECRLILNQSDSHQITNTESYQRSNHCSKCKKKLTVLQQIPILSYLLMKGKCRECHEWISIRHPLTELLVILMPLMVVNLLGISFTTLMICVFIWMLILLSIIDIDTQLLPDQLTLSLLWLGLILNSQEIFIPLLDAVYGAIFGYLSLWTMFWLFKIVTKKEGLGYGDFKLLAALGAWLGWQAMPSIILIASFFGSIIGLIYLASKKLDKSNPIPFGPFLAIGGIMNLLMNDQIQQFFVFLWGWS